MVWNDRLLNQETLFLQQGNDAISESSHLGTVCNCSSCGPNPPNHAHVTSHPMPLGVVSTTKKLAGVVNAFHHCLLLPAPLYIPWRHESISPKCNWTAQPCFVLSAQQPKGRCFGALAQCGDSKPTHPFSLVYAHSPQPKTLSLNQWMPPPKKIGLGGGYMKAIQCSCMLVVPPPPPLGGDSHLAAQPWGIAGDHYMLGGR
jgi:hypothetical protein